jgi:hypothetical protein
MIGFQTPEEISIAFEENSQHSKTWKFSETAWISYRIQQKNDGIRIQ